MSRPHRTSSDEPARTSLEIGAALAAAGFRFLLWKSNGHLAEALAAKTDLDIYADATRCDEVRNCLREQRCIRVISPPWSAYPDVEDWLTVDPETGRILHLHLHFALVTGLRRIKHLRLPWDEALLANTNNALNAVWPTPTPEMELMILIVRMWAKMPPWRRLLAPRLPASVRWELDWLIARCDREKLRGLATCLLSDADADVVLGVLAVPPLTDRQVLAVSRLVYGKLKGGYRLNWWIALLQSGMLSLRAAARKELRKFRTATVTGKRIEGPGLVVAFVGSDGSGKSTLTREVGRWLKYKLDVHSYYLGSGSGSKRLLDRVRNGLKPRTRRQPTGGATRDVQGPRKRRGFFSRLLAIHRLLEIKAKLRALREAHRLADGGSISILDRLPQAQFNGIGDGPRLQEGNSFGWVARAEMKQFAELAALAPHLVVKLVVSPEVAHARKPDHSLEKLQQKVALTKQLTYGVPVIEIDANQPFDLVLLQVKQVVWNALRARALGQSVG